MCVFELETNLDLWRFHEIAPISFHSTFISISCLNWIWVSWKCSDLYNYQFIVLPYAFHGVESTAFSLLFQLYMTFHSNEKLSFHVLFIAHQMKYALNVQENFIAFLYGFHTTALVVFALHPIQEKVKAVKEVPSPKSVSELKSYLGLLMYYSKFLLNMADVLASLYKLLCKDVQRQWTDTEEKAFQAFWCSACSFQSWPWLTLGVRCFLLQN